MSPAGQTTSSRSAHTTWPRPTTRRSGYFLTTTHPRGSARTYFVLLSFDHLEPGAATVTNDYCLDIGEFANAVAAELAAVAAVFDAAEGQPRVGGNHTVDEDAAGFDAARQVLGAGGVASPQIRAQAVLGVVGETDGLVRVAGANDRGDRAEGLLAERRHRVLHPVQDGRLEEIAVAVQCVAANHGVRAG